MMGPGGDPAAAGGGGFGGAETVPFAQAQDAGFDTSEDTHPRTMCVRSYRTYVRAPDFFNLKFNSDINRWFWNISEQNTRKRK